MYINLVIYLYIVIEQFALLIMWKYLSQASEKYIFVSCLRAIVKNKKLKTNEN